MDHIWPAFVAFGVQNMCFCRMDSFFARLLMTSSKIPVLLFAALVPSRIFLILDPQSDSSCPLSPAARPSRPGRQASRSINVLTPLSAGE